MERKSKDARERPAPSLRCAHYWIIESPGGPKSRGTCKLCGAECEFRNYVPRQPWKDRPCKDPEVPDPPHIETEEPHAGLRKDNTALDERGQEPKRGQR